MYHDPSVVRFCRQFVKSLDADNWGDIPVDVFRNIAESGSHDADMHLGKMSFMEMSTSVTSMSEILEEILDTD